MADEIKWIRMKVGMFDGNSFKKIKRAKIAGVSYRDKLTAIWFELLDLAGKSNANGYLMDNNAIPYRTFDDIATQIDRDEKEVELCMNFFESEKMIEFSNDMYCVANFVQYQNQEGLDQIRAQNRERQARFKEKKKQALLSYPHNVTDSVTQALPITQSNAIEKELDIEVRERNNNLLAKDIKEKIITACAYAQGTGRFDKYIEMIINALLFACLNKKAETYNGKLRDSQYWTDFVAESNPTVLAKTVNSLMRNEPKTDAIRYTLQILASESDAFKES